MRTTVDLDEELVAEARRRAGQAGVSLDELLDDAIRFALTPSELVSDEPDLPDFLRGTGLRAGVDSSSNVALLDAADDGPQGCVGL